jgi:photosystem II Psb27 protein
MNLNNNLNKNFSMGFRAYLSGFTDWYQQSGWSSCGRMVVAMVVALLVVVSSFVPAADAALFTRKEEVMSTKEIQALVNAGLTGNYDTDTSDTIKMLREAVNVPNDAENIAAVKTAARYKINAYISRYRADHEKSGLFSYTTMSTALNTLAGYYNGTTKKAIPAKVRDRLLMEFDRAESALQQGR